MKRILLGLAFLFSFNSSFASLEDNWNISINPTGLFWGMVDLNLEYAITDNIVVGPAAFIWKFKIEDFKLNAAGVGLQGKYHFNGTFEDGLYAGLNGSLAKLDISKTSSTGVMTSAKATGANVALLAGYQWFWKSFNLNIGGSLGTSSIKKLELKDENDNVTEDYSAPTSGIAGFDFKIGFTF